MFAVFIFSIALLSSAKLAFADSTSGYAWSENSGWIDFSQVTVSTSVLAGYAYSPNIGWISLNCSNTSSCGTTDYKVTNSSGTLSGYAWSENTGWLDFSQVTINTSTGIFSGYAYSSNIGWVSMNCDNTSSCGTVDYKVITSWRPATQNHGTTQNHGISGGIVYCTDTLTTYCRPRPQLAMLPSAAPITNACNLTFIQTLKFTNPRMNNTNIKLLQTCLNTKITTTTQLISDGIFGTKTKQAVMDFQKANNIKIDGIVGPITRGLLIK